MSRIIQFRFALVLAVSFMAFTVNASDESDRELCESTLGGHCAATSSIGCECQGSTFVSLAYSCMKTGAQFYCQSEQDQCECRHSDGRIEAHFVTDIPAQMRGKNMSYAGATGPGVPVTTNPTNNGDKGTGNGTNPPTGISNAADPAKPQDATAAATPQQQAAQQPQQQQQPPQPPQMPGGGGGDQKPQDQKQDGGSPQFGQCKANPAMNDDSQLDSAANQFCSSGKGQVQGAIQKFKQAKKKCGQDNQQGNMKCYESCNKDTQNGVSNAMKQFNTNGKTVEALKQDQAANNGLSDAMKNHMAQCGAAKSACDSSCAEANKAKDDLKQKAQQAAQQCQQMEGQQTKDQKEGKQSMAGAGQINSALGQEDQKSGEFGPSLADKTSQCGNDMSRENNGAAKNLGELMKALADALQKQKNAEAQGAGDQTAAASTTPNPCVSGRESGCSLAGETQDPTKIGVAAADPRKPASTTAGTTTSTAGGLADMGSMPGGSGDSASAASIGGSGGGGSAGGFSKSADKEAVKTIPNGNILGGIDSGGGGGGGWASSAKKAVDALRSYLPGQSKAPKQIAGQGITGPGGWTNWDKVRRRYEDKRATFLTED